MYRMEVIERKQDEKFYWSVRVERMCEIIICTNYCQNFLRVLYDISANSIFRFTSYAFKLRTISWYIKLIKISTTIRSQLSRFIQEYRTVYKVTLFPFSFYFHLFLFSFLLPFFPFSSSRNNLHHFYSRRILDHTSSNLN